MPSRIFTLPKALLWLNILSLDAPLVAVVWQDFFAWNLGLRLTVVQRVILAASIWLAYAADRWLDGWRIPRGAAVTPRHRFAQDYRVPLACVWALVLCGTVMLGWFSLPSYFFIRGLGLVLFVAVYFFLNQWSKTTRALRGLKEIAVGILFAAGTVVFVLPDSDSARTFWWPIAGWGLLCFLNCYAIALWEIEADRAEKQESLITRWPFLAHYFRWTALAVALFALAPLLVQVLATSPRLGLAMATSAFALALLDYCSGALEADLLRMSADFVLFTPLLFRFFP